MKKRKLTKRKNSKKSFAMQVMGNEKEVSKNKRSTYISGCIMVIATLAISHLQSGKINEAISIVVGSFLVIPILNQLAKLVWDE